MIPQTEPESIWQLKPWWCQPWSIVLTGVVAVLVSWWVLGRWWFTSGVALAVVLWWGLFLVLVPRAWNANGVSAKGGRES